MWQREINMRDELTIEQWKSIIDELSNFGIDHIEFFGGDALLRKDVLIPLITYAHKKNIYTEMPTNCNLLDENTAINLVNAGLDDIWISLDAPDKAHDIVRGREGTFNKVDGAIQAINTAKREKESPRIFINCVITQNNLDSFEKIIPYAQEKGIYGIDFEYVGEFPQESITRTELKGLHPTPFFMSTEDSSLIDMEGAILLKKKLSDIKNTSRSNRTRLNTSKIDILSKQDIVSGKFPNKRCYICRDWFTVDPFGNVIGCLHYNNYHIGNLKESTPAALWKNYEHRQFIKARDNGAFHICNHCSNGAIRNNTLFQTLQTKYYSIMKREKM